MSGSYVDVGVAPTKNQITDRDFLTKVWLQHLTDVSDALEGSWGPVSSAFDLTPSTGVTVGGQLQGNVLQLVIRLDSVSASQGDTLTWTYPFTAQPTILDCYQLNGGIWSINDGCYVEGKTLTLPAITSTEVIIKGTLLRV